MITLIVTALGSVAAVISVNIYLISWLRDDRKSFEAEIRGWKAAINAEMKDFHGKLCAIEARQSAKTSDEKQAH